MQRSGQCAWCGVWFGFGFFVLSAAVSRPRQASGSVPSASLTRLCNKTSEKLKTCLPLIVLRKPGPGLPESGTGGWLCQESAPEVTGVQVKSHPPLGCPWGSASDGASLASVLPSVKEETRVRTLRVLVMFGKGTTWVLATQGVIL